MLPRAQYHQLTTHETRASATDTRQILTVACTLYSAALILLLPLCYLFSCLFPRAGRSKRSGRALKREGAWKYRCCLQQHMPAPPSRRAHPTPHATTCDSLLHTEWMLLTKLLRASRAEIVPAKPASWICPVLNGIGMGTTITDGCAARADCT